jgi:RHS repeat-associated protein
MAGISDKALKSNYAENKYRANGGDELQNKEFNDGSGLEEYDATFRMYDPQIGRFWQIDPLAIVTADYSPYSFAIDNPILFNDPLGLLSDSTHPQVLPTATFTYKPPSEPTSQVDVGLADTKGGAPDVSAAATAAAPLPSASNSENTAGNEEKSDHNLATDIAYELNKFNPLAQIVNLGYVYFTGADSYGVQQSKTQAWGNLAATIPVGRAGAGVELGVSLIEQGIASTGRTEAANLTEKLAMEEIKSNPALGERILRMKPLTDSRWKGWVKMTNNAAHGVEIHFNALFKDGVMVAVDDFKFK